MYLSGMILWRQWFGKYEWLENKHELNFVWKASHAIVARTIFSSSAVSKGTLECTSSTFISLWTIDLIDYDTIVFSGFSR